MQNKKNYFVILGAGLMQIPAIQKAMAQGLRTVVFDGNRRALGADQADFFYPIDLKYPVRMYRKLQKLGIASDVAGVFTAGTDFSLSVARLQKLLGLPGNSLRTARLASHKHSMRRALAAAGVPSPGFVSLGPFSRLFARTRTAGLSFPLVVKPVDNMGSRGVVKVSSPSNVSAAVVSAIRYSRTRRCIVEEFIPGTEYSIDGLFQDGELLMYGIAVRHIDFPPYFIETGHSFPSGLKEHEELELLSVFQAAVSALGIRSGAAKGDVFLGPAGAVIGEIAARLSGGYMSAWTLPYASGLDFTSAGIHIALGKHVAPRSWVQRHACFERAVISFPGSVIKVQMPADMQDLPGFKEWFARVEVGARTMFPKNNVEKAGNLIFAGPNPMELQTSIEYVFDTLLIVLDPADAETRSAILDPLSANIPVAYPQNLAGQFAPEERAWDCRSFAAAKHSLDAAFNTTFDSDAGLSKSADYNLALRVLKQCGLQAGLVLADILRYGKDQESRAWLERVRAVYG